MQLNKHGDDFQQAVPGKDHSIHDQMCTFWLCNLNHTRHVMKRFAFWSSMTLSSSYTMEEGLWIFRKEWQGAACQNDSEPKSGYCLDVTSSKKSRKHYFSYIQIIYFKNRPTWLFLVNLISFILFSDKLCSFTCSVCSDLSI